ncbi:Predicted ATPase [Prevotellaceae bacterium MN60]|nr:Predicted ATPase [Prevotellaceae bacterium MN60]
MKQIDIIINKLGAIRDSKLKLKPLMLFSGESGLGKSYAAFLIHYLYFLLSDSNDRLKLFFSDHNYDFESIFDNVKSGSSILTIPKKDVFDWLNRDAISYIGYLIGNEDFMGDIEIKIPCDYDDFVFVYREDLGGLEGQEEMMYHVELSNFSYNILSSKFEKNSHPFVLLLKAELKDILFGDYKDMGSTYLLPPSRGALMEINERPSFVSGMYQEFFDFKNVLNVAIQRPEEVNPQILECCVSVNEGILNRVDGRIMYNTHGVVMPLTAAASSVKELAPLTLFLNRYSAKGVSFLFEEPEAHLHPNRQMKVADMISCMVNDGAHMQITTHSDYLIKRFNNLINLYLLRDVMDSEEYIAFLQKWNIKEMYLLNPQNVGAYIVQRDDSGTSHIVEQDVLVDKEISFDSFYAAIKNDMELTREIRNRLKE